MLPDDADPSAPHAGPSPERSHGMSTGGPNPNSDLEPDPDTARGDLGDPSVTRLGMPSLITGIVILVIAVLVLLYMIL